MNPNRDKFFEKVTDSINRCEAEDKVSILNCPETSKDITTIDYIMQKKDDFRVIWIEPKAPNYSDPKIFGLNGRYGKTLQEPLQPVIMSCSVYEAIDKCKYNLSVSDKDALIDFILINWARVQHKLTGIVCNVVNEGD